MGVALKIQDSVDHVLQHTGPSQGALFGDVANQDDGRTGGFGGTSEVCGALSDLRHRTWRRGELVGVDRLNGVNDRNVGTLALQGGKNFFKLNFGQHLDLAVV